MDVLLNFCSLRSQNGLPLQINEYIHKYIFKNREKKKKKKKEKKKKRKIHKRKKAALMEVNCDYFKQPIGQLFL